MCKVPWRLPGPRYFDASLTEGDSRSLAPAELEFEELGTYESVDGRFEGSVAAAIPVGIGAV